MKLDKALFPLNAWYAAAYDVEVTRQLLPRTICKQKLVLFRKTDGKRGRLIAGVFAAYFRMTTNGHIFSILLPVCFQVLAYRWFMLAVCRNESWKT